MGIKQKLFKVMLIGILTIKFYFQRYVSPLHLRRAAFNVVEKPAQFLSGAMVSQIYGNAAKQGDWLQARREPMHEHSIVSSDLGANCSLCGEPEF